MIDEIVGLIGRDADGNEAAFMTWGRVLHHDDPSIESLVLRYSKGCSLRSELASVDARSKSSPDFDCAVLLRRIDQLYRGAVPCSSR